MIHLTSLMPAVPNPTIPKVFAATTGHKSTSASMSHMASRAGFPLLLGAGRWHGAHVLNSTVMRRLRRMFLCWSSILRLKNPCNLHLRKLSYAMDVACR